MNRLKKSQMFELIAGHRGATNDYNFHDHQAGPKEEIAKGFYRAAGAFLFFVIEKVFGDYFRKQEQGHNRGRSYNSPSGSGFSF